jgi:multidrug efflux pump subunit AcrB
MSTAMLLVATMESEDPRFDDLYLGNYATIYLLDQIKRIPGVGDAIVYGAKDYAMRIWLDPDRLAQKRLTVTDMKNAIGEQNALFAAGRIGGRPTGSETQMTLPVITRGRLSEPSEFENVILRANPDGSMVRVKDVGRAELGSRSYDLFGRKNGKPTALIILYLLPGANALDTADTFVQTMENASASFPRA